MNVLLDANVLYSITLTDVLLTLADAGLLSPLWTERILDEAIGALRERLEDGSTVRAGAIDQRFAAMRRAFASATIEGQEFEQLIPAMTNHAGDRHVLAAAEAYEADVILTWNVRDFPPESLWGLRVGGVTTPDRFLCDLLRVERPQVVAAIGLMISAKRRPPVNVRDLSDRLAASGARAFARELRLAFRVPASATPPP